MVIGGQIAGVQIGDKTVMTVMTSGGGATSKTTQPSKIVIKKRIEGISFNITIRTQICMFILSITIIAF